MTRRIYDAIGLSASRAAFLHLMLISAPFGFGLQPLGLPIRQYLPAAVEYYYGKAVLGGDDLNDPCGIFAPDGDPCTPTEIFLLRDWGTRLLLYQSLAWMVWFVMLQSRANLKALHKLLMVTTCGSLLNLSWLQGIWHPALPTPPPLEGGLFMKICTLYGVALLLSSWTALVYEPPPPLEAMKWSIPANAIFWGGIMNLLIATASWQAILEEGGVEQYFADATAVTSRVRLVFCASAWYTLAHATLLLRIRAFLTMSQLRRVCLYKLVMSVALPLVWLPEDAGVLVVDRRLTFAIRGSLVLTYLFGFLWAGQAQGLSSILSGEKED